MALIKCPECGRENVSDTASFCPACGYNIKNYVALMKKRAQEEKKRINNQKEHELILQRRQKYVQTELQKYIANYPGPQIPKKREMEGSHKAGMVFSVIFIIEGAIFLPCGWPIVGIIFIVIGIFALWAFRDEIKGNNENFQRQQAEYARAMYDPNGYRLECIKNKRLSLESDAKYKFPFPEDREREYRRKLEENQRTASAPWNTQYYNSPCPYCGSYKVRLAKWEDKQMSTAFWGAFSYELHCHYKCDNCHKMWE